MLLESSDGVTVITGDGTQVGITAVVAEADSIDDIHRCVAIYRESIAMIRCLHRLQEHRTAIVSIIGFQLNLGFFPVKPFTHVSSKRVLLTVMGHILLLQQSAVVIVERHTIDNVAPLTGSRTLDVSEETGHNVLVVDFGTDSCRMIVGQISHIAVHGPLVAHDVAGDELVPWRLIRLIITIGGKGPVVAGSP